MGQGAVFGIAIWVLFHLIIMPIMHTVPAVGSTIPRASVRILWPYRLDDDN